MGSILSGFSDRMKSVAPIEMLVRRIVSAQRYSEYDLVNITFMTLMFIFEKTLTREEDCDIADIANFLKSQMAEHYNICLAEEKARDLAYYIVMDVLQGRGKPYDFETIDTEVSEPVKIRVKLVEIDKIGLGEGERSTYVLAPMGFELVLRTREIEREMRVTIEQLRVHEELKRKNYDAALNEMTGLLDLVKNMKQEIRDVEKRITRNISNISEDEYKDLHRKIAEQIEKENQEFYRLTDRILNIKREIGEILEENKLSDEGIAASKKIQKIHNRLKDIMREHNDLLNLKMEIHSVYDHAIVNQIAAGFSEHIRLGDLVENCDEDLNLDAYVAFLNPAQYHFSKIFNPFKFFECQPPLSKKINFDSQEHNSLESTDEAEDTAEDLAVKELSVRYALYVRNLLLHYAEKREPFTLESFLDNLKDSDSAMYEQMISDFSFFTMLLSIYETNGGIIDLREIRESFSESVIRPSGEFILEYYFGKILAEEDCFRRMKGLLVIREPGSMVYESVDSQDSYEIDNLLFEVAEEDRDD